MHNYNSSKLEKMLGDKFGVEILNSIGLATAVIDREFNILWANNQYRKVQEEPERPIIGRKCYEVSFNSKVPCSEKICAVRRTFKTSKDSRGLKILKKGGQEKMGEILYVELPSKGRKIVQKESFSTLESVKAAFDVPSPVSGEILEVNQKLNQDPSLVNKDPYGEGWLVKVKIFEPSELDSLLTSSEYEKIVEKNQSS